MFTQNGCLAFFGQNKKLTRKICAHFFGFLGTQIKNKQVYNKTKHITINCKFLRFASGERKKSAIWVVKSLDTKWNKTINSEWTQRPPSTKWFTFYFRPQSNTNNNQREIPNRKIKTERTMRVPFTQTNLYFTFYWQCYCLFRNSIFICAKRRQKRSRFFFSILTGKNKQRASDATENDELNSMFHFLLFGGSLACLRI